jgi:hypothetical protein
MYLQVKKILKNNSYHNTNHYDFFKKIIITIILNTIIFSSDINNLG